MAFSGKRAIAAEFPAFKNFANKAVFVTSHTRPVKRYHNARPSGFKVMSGGVFRNIDKDKASQEEIKRQRTHSQRDKL